MLMKSTRNELLNQCVCLDDTQIDSESQGLQQCLEAKRNDNE